MGLLLIQNYFMRSSCWSVFKIWKVRKDINRNFNRDKGEILLHEKIISCSLNEGAVLLNELTREGFVDEAKG